MNQNFSNELEEVRRTQKDHEVLLLADEGSRIMGQLEEHIYPQILAEEGGS